MSLTAKIKNKNHKKKKKIESDPIHEEIRFFLNSEYTQDQCKQKFIECWINGGQTGSYEVLQEPFRCAFLKQLIGSETALQKVVTELDELEYTFNNTDLFKFQTTEDLKNICTPAISNLVSFIRKPLRKWVQNVTGLKLNKQVSIASSRYNHSDVLLCHDDELEGRRIAFVLYLVPQWNKQFGGSLDLFRTDSHYRPISISRQIFPEFNSLVFFEVSPASYHQVSEVIGNKCRLSINGWFHGDPIKYPQRPIVKPHIFCTPVFVEEKIPYSWMNPIYLHNETQAQVRKVFQEKSEIQLPNFLKESKYECLCKALRGKQEWRWKGPPCYRHYEMMPESQYTEVVQEFVALMRSEAMVLIMSQLTGLELHELAPKEEEVDGEGEIREVEEEDTSKSEDDCERIVKKRKMHNEDIGSEDDEEESDVVEEDGEILQPKKKYKNYNKPSAKTNVIKYPTTFSANCTQESENVPGTSTSQTQIIIKSKSKKDKNLKEQNFNIDESVTKGSSEEYWDSNEDQEINIKKKKNNKNGSKAEVNAEVRRWKWGSYSLLSGWGKKVKIGAELEENRNKDGEEEEGGNFTLDAMLYCNVSPDWDVTYGGSTIYVAKEEKEELLSVFPSKNAFSIVYRDEHTQAFTKHVNYKAKKLGEVEDHFQSIIVHYREMQ